MMQKEIKVFLETVSKSVVLMQKSVKNTDCLEK